MVIICCALALLVVHLLGIPVPASFLFSSLGFSFEVRSRSTDIAWSEFDGILAAIASLVEFRDGTRQLVCKSATDESSCFDYGTESLDLRFLRGPNTGETACECGLFGAHMFNDVFSGTLTRISFIREFLPKMPLLLSVRSSSGRVSPRLDFARSKDDFVGFK